MKYKITEANMKFTAAGDAIIQRRIQKDFAGYREIAPFISQGDARFFNLETTLNRAGEAFCSQFSGGTYIRSDPDVLSDLKEFGFNMTSFNNNHALDFSYLGLERTLDALNESGLVHAGVGKNLTDASAPRYLETDNGRVALISVSTSFNPTMIAGNENGRFPGRPGVNAVRINDRLTVTEKELELIQALAQRLGINAGREISRAEGYLPPLDGNCAELGELKFYSGEKTERVYQINEVDMKRVEKAIFEAKFGADYLMLSIHSHQVCGTSKENIPEFLSDFAHKCIDLGADAIVGHGPHLLRPIEVYNGKPIFYSLGDFILELYSIEAGPADFFERFGLEPDESMYALLKKRSHEFTVGLMEDRRMMETVIPYWETDVDNRLVSLRLLPVELTRSGNKSQVGLPGKAKDLTLVDRLAEISKPYGVTMQIEEDGTVTCHW